MKKEELVTLYIDALNEIAGIDVNAKLSNYQRTCLKELADEFPDHKARINQCTYNYDTLQTKRLVESLSKENK